MNLNLGWQRNDTSCGAVEVACPLVSYFALRKGVRFFSSKTVFSLFRWWQLASGLTSRDTLRVLLKELGPAAESDHLEQFDGLVNHFFDKIIITPKSCST